MSGCIALTISANISNGLEVQKWLDPWAGTILKPCLQIATTCFSLQPVLIGLANVERCEKYLFMLILSFVQQHYQILVTVYGLKCSCGHQNHYSAKSLNHKTNHFFLCSSPTKSILHATFKRKFPNHQNQNRAIT